jgi:hypothetical protein
LAPPQVAAEDYPPKAHTHNSCQNTSTLLETPFKSTQVQQKLYIEKTSIFAHPETITPTESIKPSLTHSFFTAFRKIISNKTNPLPKKTVKKHCFSAV